MNPPSHYAGMPLRIEGRAVCPQTAAGAVATARPTDLRGKRRSFMLIAGEPSGDALGAQLVTDLRPVLAHELFAPVFHGAGGPRMAGAGVALDLDLKEL